MALLESMANSSLEPKPRPSAVHQAVDAACLTIIITTSELSCGSRLCELLVETGLLPDNCHTHRCQLAKRMTAALKEVSLPSFGWSTASTGWVVSNKQVMKDTAMSSNPFVSLGEL